MHTTTEELLLALKSAPNLDAFFIAYEDKFISISTVDYLNDLLSQRNINIADVAKNSGAGEYVYKIFKGERKPSRNVLISIAFGMQLSLDETQLLLRISKFAILDSRDMRDSIIIFALTRHMSVFETDDLLDEKNQVTIN